jgi:thiol-disulfide isomerase/thioredoxin
MRESVPAEGHASLVARLGLALVRPTAALAIAGDRRHTGRSGSDLLAAICVLLLATQLRALVAAGWLGVSVDAVLGVRALVQTLSDSIVVDLGFLVVGAAVIYAASGPRRELGRAFDLACVAALPLLFVDLAASVVVYAAELSVPRNVMWLLSSTSYVWTGVLVALAVRETRRAVASQIGDLAVPRKAGWGLVALAAAGIIVQIVWLGRHVDHVRPMTPGDPAPEFSLPRIVATDTLGDNVSLADSRGKVTVIDFWATWCGPCLKALPKLDALARRHTDVVVLAINIDDGNEAFALFSDRKYAMTLLAGDRETSERYGVAAIPHTVVIDREGNVRRVFRGSTTEIEREVSALLK